MYDLIVLGGGPAGYRAAERAGAEGMKTLVIEKRALGGVCLNEGCIPSKTLLNSAKIYDYANGYGEKYGVSTTGAKLDHAFVINRKNKVVKTLVSGIGAAMKKYKVEVVYAEGKITGRTANGFSVEAEGKTYETAKLLIATGSEALVPPIPGLREGLAAGHVLTNREILDLDHVPESLCVIGGGVIGLEMASYFCSAGAHIEIVEMMDKIAGPTDREISAMLQKHYEKKGIIFRLGAKVVEVKPGEVIYEKDGKRESVKAEKILCSIGRRAVTANIGLESIGVACERGAILTDDQMKTNVPGVFAAGDVNARIMLAHTAYREAEVAINTMLGRKDSMNYNEIPSVIYTNPEVASVGETLDSAKKKGIDAEERKIPMAYSGRFLAENEGGEGICKAVIDKKSHKLLGVHMMGNPCSEIIVSAALMLNRELRLADLERLVFPHPTVGEVMREFIFD
ncbi:MAG: dihydrolipoyl dehydrogenase [Clostridia bacterium]|nr:dihydrolipoyl dehydrogenase [Clostridia bacterium]